VSQFWGGNRLEEKNDGKNFSKIVGTLYLPPIFSETVTGTGIYILPSLFLLICSLPKTGRQRTAPLYPTLGSPLTLKNCGNEIVILYPLLKGAAFAMYNF